MAKKTINDATKRDEKEEKEETRTHKKDDRGVSWFRTGDEGIKEKKKLDYLSALRKEKSAPRFRLREGEESLIVFIDDNGFYIKEHNLKVDGKWGTYVTCVRDFGPCPVCNEGKRATYTGYYSIIDTREFVKNDGTKVKNRRVLFPAKGSAINMIGDLIKKHKNLVGRVVRVKRYTANDPNCGNFFEVLNKKVNLTKFGDDGKPYDYKKVLAPPTEEELQVLGYGGVVLGSEEESISEEDLTDILD